MEAHGLRSCSSWAQSLCCTGVRDLPGPGLDPLSPALAGRFLTSEPPGKPPTFIFIRATGKLARLQNQFSSVDQSCPTLWHPMDCCTPGLPVHPQLPELTQTLMSFESVMPSKHLILCHPLLFLPSIFPSIRVLSSESVLPIRWPKYWSFSFSISPSNEYSGLISLKMDWLDLLAVQGTLNSLLQHRNSKA